MLERIKVPQESHREAGFVMPVVLFALVLMSTVAVSALFVSSDEHKASQAMRLSSLSFYTAEGGLNQVFATWDNYTDSIGALAPGDSFDLGWQTLTNGAAYRAVIHRWDSDADQPLYRLTTTGQGEGPFMGSRTLAVSLTLSPGEPGDGYMIGECCDAPATVRGTAELRDGSIIDGHDQHPAGWGDADVCADTAYDRPGMLMQDTSLLILDDLEDGTAITGEPPIIEDPTLSDDDFFQFGPDLTWQDLKDMADYVVGTPGSGTRLTSSDLYPRYNADGTCDTSHPYNWGSTDPSDPCFNHFPIVLLRGDVNLEDVVGVYGQGILVLDFWAEGDSLIGSELDIEDNATFNGIVLGKGCLEVQRLGTLNGAAYVDGNYKNPLCGGDATLDLNNPGFVNWSQCAVDRAMLNSGLADFAEPKWPGEAGGVKLLKGRSFMEMY